MRLGRRAGWPDRWPAHWSVIALAVFVLIALARAGGYLAPAEYFAADLRASLLQHEVKSDIVVVSIDPQSIRELGDWPWPRRYHAELIERLRQADPRQVFIDIDFSSPSNPVDDGLLESALASWHDARGASTLILPVLVQSITPADSEAVTTKPLPQFSRHVTLGSVNQRRSADGFVRGIPTSWTEAGETFPSAAARLSNKALRSDTLLPIDFSMSIASFASVSYVDLLAGRVPSEELKGKTIMIGATAVELGDLLPVPVYHALPGVVVQALATETISAGQLYEIPQGFYLAALAIWIALCAAAFCAWSWRRNLIAIAAGLAAIAGAALYAYSAHRLAIEVIPAALAACAVFLITTLRSLEEHIEERKAQRRKLEYQAKHDSLTTLPNRVALAEHLQRVLPSTQPGKSVALLMLDLCRFKEVNDTLGHNVGDAVLREVARRFRDCVRRSHDQSNNGFIARIGGDEFTAVLDSLQDPKQMVELSLALNEALRTPIAAGGIALDVGVSIGIALYPEDASDAETLLKHADVAMYVSKRRSSAYEYYDAAQDEHSVRKLTMVTELRAALADETLSLYYQPQVDLRSGQVESAEALLRWKHPTLGAVNPAEFVAVAEATDLIRPLTRWTLTQALDQIAHLGRHGLKMRIAVNLSARMLQDICFPAELRTLLQASNVDPRLLEIEITESAMMLDPARALRVIREIHSLGVLISIDDYGTGFSSLGYLRDLPVHALKLDKSFVLDMNEREDNRVIVTSTVQMAHALKLQAVAEGAETDWHVRFLASAGYDYAQGYCYSPALPANEFKMWVDCYAADPEFNKSGARA